LQQAQPGVHSAASFVLLFRKLMSTPHFDANERNHALDPSGDFVASAS
jgi:hypothetical protein